MRLMTNIFMVDFILLLTITDLIIHCALNHFFVAAWRFNCETCSMHEKRQPLDIVISYGLTVWSCLHLWSPTCFIVCPHPVHCCCHLSIIASSNPVSSSIKSSLFSMFLHSLTTTPVVPHCWMAFNQFDHHLPISVVLWSVVCIPF